MTLRHAVLVALLDNDASGYQLVKSFDVSVANFWSAGPQQIYAELARLERDGLISGREVVQSSRPNKRMFTVTDAGRTEIAAFVEAPSKPGMIRDDLLVKVFTVGADRRNDERIAAELDQCAHEFGAKAALLASLLVKMRRGRTEQEYIQAEERIGPYLTCLRGQLFESENARLCSWVAETIRARLDGRPVASPLE